MLIGLTGLYCAGKNFIASLLEKRGVPVLDVDKLGYRAIDAEQDAVLARFGSGVLDGNGRVNRRLLGERVFGKPEELAALEAIVHPAVNRLTDAWIVEQGGKACAINAALLHKSSVFGKLDRIILVEAPFLARLFRARKRDRLPWPVIIRRFRSQKGFTPQYFSGKADIYRVENRTCPFLAGILGKKLENRIDEILSGGVQ
ncbi:MAG: dephospho-CoA kinase [Treponema sp.]|jgi:dephospho-CoA kinase|nr:dephospho-CoA kinase [Treponema sp.]